MYESMYVRMYVSTYECMYVRTYVSTYVKYVYMYIGFVGAVEEGLGFNFSGTAGVGFIGNFQSWGWSGAGLNLTVAGGSGAILLT